MSAWDLTWDVCLHFTETKPPPSLFSPKTSCLLSSLPQHILGKTTELPVGCYPPPETSAFSYPGNETYLPHLAKYKVHIF